MLETTWFILWGVLWVMYFALDGFDLGIGALMPFLSKTDTDRRIMLNAMGPFWDGNEVWLITAGGVTFAAFPTAYAVMFSSLYSPLMLILFALIFRGISFEFRGKFDNPAWKKLWDGCLIGGSIVTAVLFGVAFANIFKGIPIQNGGFSNVTILGLLNPYGILGGLLFLTLFIVHGALWLVIKSQGDLAQRSLQTAKKWWPVLLGLTVLFLVLSGFYTSLYGNYFKWPFLWIIPAATTIFLGIMRIYMEKNHWIAWAASALTIAGAVMFGIAGLYPNLLPSSINPKYSLTIDNSASSPLTLKIMLGVVLVFVPIVIIYQCFVYYFFRHKVTHADLAQ